MRHHFLMCLLALGSLYSLFFLCGCSTTRTLAHADYVEIHKDGVIFKATNVVLNAYKPADMAGAVVGAAIGAVK